MDDKEIVCLDCIVTEHKFHNVVKIEEAIEYCKIDLKKQKKEIEKSLINIKDEQTKVNEEIKKLKKKSIEFEEKKEKFQFELKKIIELELNQNLKEIINFKDKMIGGGDQILKISDKKLKSFDNLYSFGNNKSGGLGIEKRDKIRTPTMITFFKDTKIRTLSSSIYHTIVLTGNQQFFLLIYDWKKENNELYSFGDNSRGQLGNNKRYQGPQEIEFFKNMKIKQISCGARYSLILTAGR